LTKNVTGRVYEILNFGVYFFISLNVFAWEIKLQPGGASKVSTSDSYFLTDGDAAKAVGFKCGDVWSNDNVWFHVANVGKGLTFKMNYEVCKKEVNVAIDKIMNKQATNIVLTIEDGTLNISSITAK
jgi:hypothetical protein